jgi:hypothetical protein
MRVSGENAGGMSAGARLAPILLFEAVLYRKARLDKITGYFFQTADIQLSALF